MSEQSINLSPVKYCLLLDDFQSSNHNFNAFLLKKAQTNPSRRVAAAVPSLSQWSSNI